MRGNPRLLAKEGGRHVGTDYGEKGKRGWEVVATQMERERKQGIKEGGRRWEGRDVQAGCRG